MNQTLVLQYFQPSSSGHSFVGIDLYNKAHYFQEIKVLRIENQGYISDGSGTEVSVQKITLRPRLKFWDAIADKVEDIKRRFN
jgi:hypothetical protein